MSRTDIDLRAVEPAGLQLSDIPNIRSKAAAVAWYRDELGIEVTLNNVTAATNSRELASYMIGTAVHYSTRDLWTYITRNRRAQQVSA